MSCGYGIPLKRTRQSRGKSLWIKFGLEWMEWPLNSLFGQEYGPHIPDIPLLQSFFYSRLYSYGDAFPHAIIGLVSIFINPTRSTLDFFTGIFREYGHIFRCHISYSLRSIPRLMRCLSGPFSHLVSFPLFHTPLPMPNASSIRLKPLD